VHSWEFDLKTYRINRLRKSRGDGPQGFESLECCDGALPAKELFVPSSVAEHLMKECTLPERVVEPEPQAPRTHAPAAPVDRRSEFHVTLVLDQVAARLVVDGKPPREVLVQLAELPPRRIVQVLERAIARVHVAGRLQVGLCDVETSSEARALH
jgi:hypothetical protein